MIKCTAKMPRSGQHTCHWLQLGLVLLLAGIFIPVLCMASDCFKVSTPMVRFSNGVDVVHVTSGAKQTVRFDVMRNCNDVAKLVIDVNRQEKEKSPPWVALCTVGVERVAEGCNCATIEGGLSCEITEKSEQRQSFTYKLTERKNKIGELIFTVQFIVVTTATEATTTKVSTATTTPTYKAPDVSTGRQETTTTHGQSLTLDMVMGESKAREEEWVANLPIVAAVNGVVVIVIIVVVVVVVLRIGRKPTIAATIPQDTTSHDAAENDDTSRTSGQQSPRHRPCPGRIYEEISDNPAKPPLYQSVRRGRTGVSNPEAPNQTNQAPASHSTLPSTSPTAPDARPSSASSACHPLSITAEAPPTPERNAGLPVARPMMPDPQPPQLCVGLPPLPVKRFPPPAAEPFIAASPAACLPDAAPLACASRPPPLACTFRPTSSVAEAGYEYLRCEVVPPALVVSRKKPASPKHIYTSLLSDSQESLSAGSVESVAADPSVAKPGDVSRSKQAGRDAPNAAGELNRSRAEDEKNPSRPGSLKRRPSHPLSVQTPSIRVSFARQRSTASSSSGAELTPESPSGVLLIRFESPYQSPINVTAQPLWQTATQAPSPSSSDAAGKEIRVEFTDMYGSDNYLHPIYPTATETP